MIRAESEPSGSKFISQPWSTYRGFNVKTVAGAFNKEKALVGSGRGSDCETYKLLECSFPALLVTVIMLGSPEW